MRSHTLSHSYKSMSENIYVIVSVTPNSDRNNLLISDNATGINDDGGPKTNREIMKKISKVAQ